MPSQKGRRWLITGATRGLGEATAFAAAEAGATLILPSRDLARAEELNAELGGRHEIVHLDLAGLDMIRETAKAITGDIDVLVNNAGTMTRRREETEDGFERVLGINFLGPFALTNLLLPQVRRRVVIMASDAHRTGSLHHRDPHFRRRKWSIAGAYSASKLADMLWGLALSRRLRGTGLDVHLVHPGWVPTDIYNTIASDRWEKAISWLVKPVGHSPDEGALSTLFAATADIPECSYVGPDGLAGMRGSPSLLGRSAMASDPREAEWAWDFAVRETGIDIPSLPGMTAPKKKKRRYRLAGRPEVAPEPGSSAEADS
jgi:NAD(P)-dependent dehydrogenase (short-subunit alcohol dehydrogenase family)